MAAGEGDGCGVGLLERDTPAEVAAAAAAPAWNCCGSAEDAAAAERKGDERLIPYVKPAATAGFRRAAAVAAAAGSGEMDATGFSEAPCEASGLRGATAIGRARADGCMATDEMRDAASQVFPGMSWSGFLVGSLCQGLPRYWAAAPAGFFRPDAAGALQPQGAYPRARSEPSKASNAHRGRTARVRPECGRAASTELKG